MAKLWLPPSVGKIVSGWPQEKGVKPTCAVKPRGDVKYWWDIGDKNQCLVTGSPLEFSIGTPKLTWTKRHPTRYGLAARITDLGSGWSRIKATKHEVQPFWEYSQTTWVLRLSHDVTTGGVLMISPVNSGAGEGVYLQDYRIRVLGSGPASQDLAVSGDGYDFIDNEVLTVVLSLDIPNSRWAWAIDKGRSASGGIVSKSGTFTITPQTRTGSSTEYVFPSSTTGGLYGDMYFAAKLDRAIGEAEARQIALDPYRTLLRPANDSLYVISRPSGTQYELTGVAVSSDSTVTVQANAIRHVSPDIDSSSTVTCQVTTTLTPSGQVLYVVVQDSSISAPSVEEVKSGFNGNGVLAEYSGYQSSTTSDPYTFNASLSEGESYRSYFVWSDGEEDTEVLTGSLFATLSTVDVALSSESTVAITVTASNISYISSSVASESTVTIGVSAEKVAQVSIASQSTVEIATDDAIWRLYVVVEEAGVPDPIAAQIIAGQNGNGLPATFAQSKGADSSKPYSFIVYGLSEGTTYQPHYVVSDGFTVGEKLSAGEFQTTGAKSVRVVIDGESATAITVEKRGVIDIPVSIISSSTFSTEVIRYPKWWNDTWWPEPFWRPPFWGVYRGVVTDPVVIQSGSSVAIETDDIKSSQVVIASESACSITASSSKIVSVSIASASTVTADLGIKLSVGSVDISSASTVSIDAGRSAGIAVSIGSESICSAIVSAAKRVQVTIGASSIVSVRKNSIDNIRVQSTSLMACDVRRFGTQYVSVSFQSSSVLAVIARLQWQEQIDSQNTWSEVSDSSGVWADVSDPSSTWEEVN